MRMYIFTSSIHMYVLQVRDELARCLVEEGDYCGAETMLR